MNLRNARQCHTSVVSAVLAIDGRAAAGLIDPGTAGANASHP